MIELYGINKLRSGNSDEELTFRERGLIIFTFILYLGVMVYSVTRALKNTRDTDGNQRMSQIFLAIISPFTYILASFFLIKLDI